MGGFKIDQEQKKREAEKEKQRETESLTPGKCRTTIHPLEGFTEEVNVVVNGVDGGGASDGSDGVGRPVGAALPQRPPPGAPIPTADLEDAHYAKPLRTLSLDFDWFNNRGNTLLLQECKLVLQKVIRDVGGSPAGPLFQPTFAGLMVLHSLELFHHKLFYKLFSKEL